MDYNIMFADTLALMILYQKENNITGHCLTNTQYLYDSIKQSLLREKKTANIKAKAVFVCSYDENTKIFNFVAGHLVIIADDNQILEPSYDVDCLKNKRYYDNVKDLLDSFNDKNDFKIKSNIKQKLLKHLEFVKQADMINNGIIALSDKSYYNKQADYIEQKYKIVKKYKLSL